MSATQMLSLVFACVLFLNIQRTTLAQNTPQDYLDAHNAARSTVGVPAMTWNVTVQAYAQNYANLRKGDCILEHSTNRPYGENLAQRFGNYSAIQVVNDCVAEQQYYDYNSNTCSLGEGKCGHYTQVVWRDSTQLGCASVECDNQAGYAFIICSYYPPGNVFGQWPY